MGKGRRRRSKQNLAEDMFEIASGLPWWVGVVLALVSWVLLRGISGAGAGGMAAPQAAPALVVREVIRVFATVGQFALPILFLAGALKSLLGSAARKGAQQANHLASAAYTRPPAGKGEEKVDLYKVWRTGSSGVGEKHDQKPDGWSLELILAIDWKRFEEVCAEYFRLCGFHARTQSHGADGGIDIRLYAAGDHSSLANIVQCKRWARTVGPKELRELLGVMTANKLTKGVFVTSSSFNAEATNFARENGIFLLDGPGFLGKILSRPPNEQQQLLAVATEGDYLTPTCPSCGIKLVMRQNKKDGSQFWGCATYPRCKYTLPA